MIFPKVFHSQQRKVAYEFNNTAISSVFGLGAAIGSTIGVFLFSVRIFAPGEQIKTPLLTCLGALILGGTVGFLAEPAMSSVDWVFVPVIH